MREFRFSIHHEVGADAYADLLVEHDSLQSRAVYGAGTDSFWRLESVTGDPEAIAAVEGLLVDESVDRESVTDRDCRARRRHSLLADERGRRLVYTHFSSVVGCDAVPVLAARYSPAGLMLDRTWTGATARWRVLFQDDRKVGLLYDTLGGTLGEGRRFEFGHLTDAQGWDDRLLLPESLPDEQRATLERAVEHGYFETPREVTLDELAADLDVPRSTVSYRLRRATAALAEAFVDRGG
jgi:hypothetical protein